MLSVYALLSALVVAYGRQFGDAKVAALVSSWGIGLSQTFGIEEPIMIVISQIVPAVMEAISQNEACGAVVHEVMNSFLARAVSSCVASIHGLYCK